MRLPKLDFPAEFHFNIEVRKDKFFIYDSARRTFVLLTPEEWVRQHWIHYFHYSVGLSLSALVLEKKVELNGTTKRIDLLVTEKVQPKILVECKAPHIKLTEKTFEQTARYNSIIAAEQLILTNGIQHISAAFENGEYRFSQFSF